MGRQLVFYMNQQVQIDFIDFLKDEGFSFCNAKGEILENIDMMDRIRYLTKISYGEMVMNEKNPHSISTSRGCYIEYINSMVLTEKKTIQWGRVWIEPFFFEGTEKVQKNAEFINDYQKICRWIKKRVPHQKIGVNNETEGREEYINDEILELIKQGYRYN